MWRKLLESVEESLEGVWRQEVYVCRDLVQVIHAAHEMVGMLRSSNQHGKLVHSALLEQTYFQSS